MIWLLEKYKKRSNIYWSLIWMTVAVFIFLLSAFREGGSDWENYNSLYLQIATSESVLDAISTNFLFEPLYVALNYWFSNFFETRRELIIFESFINALAIYLLIKKTSGGPILLVWLFPLQFANIIGVRQTLATSLVIIGILSSRAPLRLAMMACAPFIHLSGLLVYIANSVSSVRISVWKTILGIGGAALIIIILQELILEKFENYFQNAAELTNLSTMDVVIGKLITMLFLAGVTILAASLSTDSWRKFNPTLVLVSLVFSFAGLVTPSLVRLSTPFELILAWQCTEYISKMRNKKEQLILGGVFVIVAALKMARISLQFQDVYQVCFFCKY